MQPKFFTATIAIVFLCLSPFFALQDSSAQNSGYWESSKRNCATTAFGNVAALAAHNCYADDIDADATSNLQATIKKVNEAIRLGADVIEFDVKQEGRDIYVAHDDNGQSNYALLSEVLQIKSLVEGDQIVFVEFKEQRPNAKFVKTILTDFVNAGIGGPGRPIVFRAFEENRKSLKVLQTALKNKEFDDIRDHVRIHELIRSPSVEADRGLKDFQSRIERSQRSGFDGVEFRYNSSNLFAKITYAKSLGLSVGLFTIPVRFGDVFIAALREDVDVLVTDFPLNRARLRIEDSNGLIHLNCWDSDADDQAIKYGSPDARHRSAKLGNDTAPKLKVGQVGQPFYGATMVFDKNLSLPLYDADNLPDEGYLVTAYVNFPTTQLAHRQTKAVFAKTDNGGFGLELFRPKDSAEPHLRFLVRVRGNYFSAMTPASRFNPGKGYFIVCGYDGDGGVRMWVDGNDTGITTTTVSGGVGLNDSPVVIGADPQGKTDSRSHFTGAIQQVQLQSWRQK